MKEYRFKEVFANGKHLFLEQEFPEESSAFKGAYMLAQICKIERVDVYLDSKLIATFYK